MTNKEIDIIFQLNTKCPLCEGTDRIPIKPSYSFKDTHYYHYWLCKCGMIYIDAYPQDQVTYYSEIGLTTYSARHGTRAHDRANRTAKETIPDSWEINSHLDVGCGNEILMQLIEEKFNCSVRGEGVEYDTRFMESRKCYTHISEVTKTYDLVTAIHVLEHDPNPLQFMKHMVSLADKYIVIEVPSMGEADFKHVSLFNPWTLGELLKKAGLELFTVVWNHVIFKDYDQAILVAIGEV